MSKLGSTPSDPVKDIHSEEVCMAEVDLNAYEYNNHPNGAVHQGETEARRNYYRKLQSFPSEDPDLLDTETISLASNSYEMIEFGLNPYEVDVGQNARRRRSCMCNNHEDFIFKDGEVIEDPDTLPVELLTRLDDYYLDSEVLKQILKWINL